MKKVSYIISLFSVAAFAGQVNIDTLNVKYRMKLKTHPVVQRVHNIAVIQADSSITAGVISDSFPTDDTLLWVERDTLKKAAKCDKTFPPQYHLTDWGTVVGLPDSLSINADSAHYADNAGYADSAGHAVLSDSTKANAPHGVTADHIPVSKGGNGWATTQITHDTATMLTKFPYHLEFDAPGTDDDFQVRTNSIDGSDTNSVVVSSAGSYSNTRGAYNYLFGNEHSSTTWQGYNIMVAGANGACRISGPSIEFEWDPQYLLLAPLTGGGWHLYPYGASTDSLVLGSGDETFLMRLRGSSVDIGGITNFVTVDTGGVVYNGKARWKAVEYYVTSATYTEGSGTGNVNLMNAIGDGCYTISEASGGTGIDMVLQFDNVKQFNEIEIVAGYAGSASHAVSIQLRDTVSSKWDTWTSAENGAVVDTTNATRTLYNYSFFPDSSHRYMSAIPGNVKLRIIHRGSGVSSHRMYVDVCKLRQ